ncbi:MAG: hypothetical protein SF029_09060 [bacterium]|nr:hypothetical protein [bacterium]
MKHLILFTLVALLLTACGAADSGIARVTALPSTEAATVLPDAPSAAAEMTPTAHLPTPTAEGGFAGLAALAV